MINDPLKGFDEKLTWLANIRKDMIPFLRIAGFQLGLIAGMIVVFKLSEIIYPKVLEVVSPVLSSNGLAFAQIVAVFVGGLMLFKLRSWYRITYGLVEIAFALVYGWVKLAHINSSDYGDSVSVVAAVYLVVRGLDNVMVGWKARQEKVKKTAEAKPIGLTAESL